MKDLYSEIATRCGTTRHEAKRRFFWLMYSHPPKELMEKVCVSGAKVSSSSQTTVLQIANTKTR